MSRGKQMPTMVQCHVCKQILRGSVCVNLMCPTFDTDHSLLNEIATLTADNERLDRKCQDLEAIVDQQKWTLGFANERELKADHYLAALQEIAGNSKVRNEFPKELGFCGNCEISHTFATEAIEHSTPSSVGDEDYPEGKCIKCGTIKEHVGPNYWVCPKGCYSGIASQKEEG